MVREGLVGMEGKVAEEVVGVGPEDLEGWAEELAQRRRSRCRPRRNGPRRCCREHRCRRPGSPHKNWHRPTCSSSTCRLWLVLELVLAALVLAASAWVPGELEWVQVVWEWAPAALVLAG